MSDLFLASLSAFWLGMLTTLSPCPLVANITAISFIARQLDHPFKVFLAGALYTLGQILVFLGLGMILTNSMLSAPALSHFLQKNMNQLLGPLLIVVGMVILEMISFRLPGFAVNATMEKHVKGLGVWGGLFLGMLFALSFCPTTAALFFGSLIPLAVQQESGVLLPAAYGLGAGLPVLFFAVLIALGVHKAAQAYRKITGVEAWARKTTGVLLIAIGIYYSLTHIFGVSL
jgi:cytochrome c-type biogenesis protein